MHTSIAAVSRSFRFAAALVATACALPSPSLRAAEAGEYDFGEFAVPGDGGEFVEVNITRDLIGIAARLVGKEEPDVAAILTGLQSVRVNVIGIDDSNRADLARRASETRSKLNDRGWQRVVTVRDSGEEVDIYIKLRGDEQIDGLVVTVLAKDGEAVFVNVVGNIKPEQLVTVGERFGIRPLEELRKHTRRG